MLTSGELCSSMLKMIYANVFEILDKLENTKKWIEEQKPQTPEEEQVIFLVKFQVESVTKKLQKFAKYCSEVIANYPLEPCKAYKMVSKKFYKLRKILDIAYALAAFEGDKDETGQTSE